MKIGFIGAGRMGGTIASLLVQAGHEVALSNSRGPETLKDDVAQLGKNARAVTTAEAAAFGDVVFVSVPFQAFRQIPAKDLAGKIVVDTANYYGRDGGIPELDAGRTTSSELVQAHLQGARLVKAFNTMNFMAMSKEVSPSKPAEGRLAMYLAGDDAEAKKVIAGLISDIGLAPVDTGSLREGGAKQQPGSPIYNRPMPVAQANQILAGL